jgi:UDP-2,3-diacylglucosamine pyrophosphatase LpxH
MITNIRTQRLVIISDLHLGNPFSQSHRKIAAFLRWAARERYDVVINGDGLEIAQASFRKLADQLPEIIRVFRELKAQGRSIYYVVGNHDIALEHFLEDWGLLSVSPFLNVESGSLRVRVEHGHLYDPFFVRHPGLYELLTHLGGFLLKVHPRFYRAWITFERFKARLRARRTGILGEPPQFAEAAHELARRGFDAVVFGHTHHKGEVALPGGKRYLNPGSWLISSHYVVLEGDHLELKLWPDAEHVSAAGRELVP